METAIGQALLGIKDTATLVLALALLGLGWLHITTIRENRQDRQALMDLLTKNTEALNGNKIAMIEALNGIKNAISAMTGKAIV